MNTTPQYPQNPQFYNPFNSPQFQPPIQNTPPAPVPVPAKQSTQVSRFSKFSPLKYPAVYTVALFSIFNVVMAIIFAKTTTDVASLSLMDVVELAEEDKKNRLRNGFVYLHIILAAVSVLYLFFRERTFFGLSIISIITTFLICFVVMYMPTLMNSINISVQTSSIKISKDKTLHNLLLTNRFMLAIFGGLFLICLGYDYMHSDQLCCKKFDKGSLNVQTCSTVAKK